MRTVLTAVSDRYEAGLVTALERSRELAVARRCADLADLLAAASAGLARVALVSAELRELDRSALDHLARAGVAVVGVHGPADEVSETRLRQLGLEVVVAADADTRALEAACVAVLQTAAADIPVAEAGWLPGPAEVAPDGVATPEGSLVAVWGPTGAPGRTTVAVTVAAELAAAGTPTLLVDADTYGGCVAQTLSLLDEAPGLAAAARAAEHGTLDVVALARLAPEVTPGLRVLTGLPKPERWPEIGAASLERVLTLARQVATVTVVDCGFSLEDDEELSYDTLAPRRNATTLTALSLADTVLAVGAGEPIGLQRLVRGLRDLSAVPCPEPVVVVNRVRAEAVGWQPERRIRDALQRFAGVRSPHLVPDDRSALDAVLLSGRTLAEEVPGSPARLALAELARTLAPVGEPATSRRDRRARRRFGTAPV
ncbi:MAG: AAA family ATPase [Oryzihumus sp.]